MSSTAVHRIRGQGAPSRQDLHLSRAAARPMTSGAVGLSAGSRQACSSARTSCRCRTGTARSRRPWSSAPARAVGAVRWTACRSTGRSAPGCSARAMRAPAPSGATRRRPGSPRMARARTSRETGSIGPSPIPIGGQWGTWPCSSSQGAWLTIATFGSATARASPERSRACPTGHGPRPRAFRNALSARRAVLHELHKRRSPALAARSRWRCSPQHRGSRHEQAWNDPRASCGMGTIASL